MKSFILSIIFFLNATLFAEWHPATELPQIGQLFMQVELNPNNVPHLRQVLIIRRYQEDFSNYFTLNGWFDVTQESLWQWFQEGNRLVYIP